MRNMPVAVTKEQLLMVLHDLVSLVEDDDSFEGSLEYLMPEPPENHDVTMDDTYVCTTCGRGVDLEWAAREGVDPAAYLTQLHAGDPALTEDGEPTRFMLRAAYRVGNSMGQGGMRMIGEMR